jgi:excinuclease ABC subunit C
LPEEPGVYRFRDDHGRALYIGRAVRLRRRVRSYWRDLRDRPHLAAMVARVARIEAIVCASDHEACWLERNLLERSRPRWNRALGGQEMAMCLVFEPGGRTPQLRLVHENSRPQRGPGLIFGPYLGSAKVRLLASALRRVHPLIYTSDELTGTARELGRIRGVGAEDRTEFVRSVLGILDRKPSPVKEFLAELDRRRDEASTNQSYEIAARVHEERAAAEWLLAPQRMTTLEPAVATSQDLYGWHAGILIKLSMINGRMSVWEQRRCTPERAAGLVTATPRPWRNVLQRNAELAALLSKESP